MEATDSDMILAIYLFEISTMTRLGKIHFSLIFRCDLLFIGCENLVGEQYRSPPVLTDPVLIDTVSSNHFLQFLV